MDISQSCSPVATALARYNCANCCGLNTTLSLSSADGGKKLLQCTCCRQVAYCSKACQRQDWNNKHKVECKVFQLFQIMYPNLPGESWNRQAKLKLFLHMLPVFVQDKDFHAMQDDNFPPKQRPTIEDVKKLGEQRFCKFVLHGRVCSICLANDFSMHATTTHDDKANTTTTTKKKKTTANWKNCSTCHYGWCCSQEHWDEYASRHSPEICQLYQRVVQMETFHFRHIRKHKENFLHAPNSVLSVPWKKFPQDWTDYFEQRFGEEYHQGLARLPSEFFPACTRLLSQPVTCLSAMYQYGISHFDNMSELTIHVVGASTYEVPPTCIWEEISHVLPAVRRLTVLFIGPQACTSINDGSSRELATYPNDCCPDCTQKGRERYAGLYGYTYHEYAEKYLLSNDHNIAPRRHSPPNLVVAFNTGMHEEDTASWQTSLATLLDMNVPCFFTSYNHEEAIHDWDALTQAGAHILQDAPQRNAFSDDVMLIDAPSKGRIDSFFACNMYGVLFQGHKKSGVSS